MRVLIVEDEEALTTLLRYNLEAEGFSVDSAARGDDAELLLAERTPDLVLLDWMLPGLSGIELCRRIRARRETERLPVIMLTARARRATGCAASAPVRTITSSSRSRCRNCWRGCAPSFAAPTRPCRRPAGGG